jgi:predicted transcriptional regulator
MTELVPTPEETLGDEFWTQPDTALTEEFRFIYAQVLGVFRAEVRERGGSAIDFLLVERMAFMYAYLRQREAEPRANLADRTRREMNKDWIDLASNMKKMWNAEDKDSTAEVVLKKVDKAIFNAIKDLPERQGRAVQEALAQSLEAVGL